MKKVIDNTKGVELYKIGGELNFNIKTSISMKILLLWLKVSTIVGFQKHVNLMMF